MPARFQFGKSSDSQSPEDLLPPAGKQFEPDPLGVGFQRMFISDKETRVPAGQVESELFRSPGAILVDTVAHLQLDMEKLRADSLCHQTWGGQTSPRRSRQTTFTSTRVPKFTGVTSLEQYQQVFDAIVLSNGLDGRPTIALSPRG